MKTEYDKTAHVIRNFNGVLSLTASETHYFANLRCGNCGKEENIGIRKGVPKTLVIRACARCGCNATPAFGKW